MSILLPSEITQAMKDSIESYTKRPEYRVLMFKGVGANKITTDPLGDGEYNASTGVYTLLEKVWVISVSFINSPFGTHTEMKIEYQNSNGDWILWHSELAEQSVTIKPQIPIFIEKLRVIFYKKNDESDLAFAPEVSIRTDEYFDITSIVGSINLETNTSGLGSEFNLPFSSIDLLNVDGRWNKNTSYTLQKYNITRVAGVYVESTTTTEDIKASKKRGTRFVILIKFRGDEFADANWIMLANFYSRKWSNSQVSGESGWTAKTKIDSPMVEGQENWDLINDFLVRDESRNLLIQNEMLKEQEVVTVIDEIVGEIEFEPILPDTILEGKRIMAHCYDGSSFYYAVHESVNGETGSGGIGVHIFSVRSGGEEVLLGTIRARSPGKLDDGIDFDANFDGLTAQSILGEQPNERPLFSSAPITAYVPYCFQMAVDEQFLYIPICDITNGVWNGVSRGIAQSCIYKLPKDGSGNEWANIFHPTRFGQHGNRRNYSGLDTTKLFTVGGVNPINPYSTDFCYSLGFNQGFQISDCGDHHYTDQSQVITGVSLITDSDGIEKLLVSQLAKRWTNNNANPQSQFYIIGKDFNPQKKAQNVNAYADVERTLVGGSGDRESVYGILWKSASTTYVLFYDRNISQMKIGVMKQDVNGDFVIELDGQAFLTPISLTTSMSFFGTGLYQSGVTINLGDAEWGSASPIGITQLYKNIFQANGYNIIHFQHADRKDFVEFLEPQIKIGGSDQKNEFIRFDFSKLNGEIYSTPLYEINLKTGDLALRQFFPSRNGESVALSYDFVTSTLFFQGKSDSRLSEDILGKIQEVSNRTFYIDESGSLNVMKFQESQAIHILDIINSYNITISVNPTINPEVFVEADLSEVNIGKDHLVGLEFIAEHDGIIEEIRIPIRLLTSTAGAQVAENIPTQVYISNSGSGDVDCTRDYPTNRDLPLTPPVSAEILELTNGVGKLNVHVGLDRTILPYEFGTPNITVSEFYWHSIDVSATARTVTKGQTYVIIFRMPYNSNMTNFNLYGIMNKGTDEPATGGINNKIIHQSITTAIDITTILSTDWLCFQSFTDATINKDMVAMMDVIIKKTSQELKSVDIIDSLNPVIESGFSTILGLVNSTFALKSLDFVTTYTRGVDYNLLYTGGKFVVQFLTFSIEDKVIAQWYDSKTKLLKLTDLVGDGVPSLSESSEHGVDTQFLRTTVNGQRLRPSDVSVRSNKRYDLFPGLDLVIDGDAKQAKNLEFVQSFDWLDKENQFESIATQVDDASKRFTFEFGDPFVTGTTAYKVRIALGEVTDNVLADTLVAGTEDIPRFYRVDCSAANLVDQAYHIILGNGDNFAYNEWRVANAEDFDDMVVDGGIHTTGTLPLDSDDIRTLDQFYLKHMNRRFSQKSVKWIVYESVVRLFFINRDGNVVEDSLFNTNDSRNPFVTAYKGKTISVIASPTDLLGNPLFDFHGEVGVDGYRATQDPSILPNMSVQITRIDIKTLGLNVHYEGYGDKKKFMTLDVIGFPINKVVELKADIRNPGSDHADARRQEITNEYMQHQVIVDRKAAINNDFWKTERLNYNKTVIYHPLLRPGTVVWVDSELEGLVGALFISLDSSHTLPAFADNSVLSSNLRKLLQI